MGLTAQALLTHCPTKNYLIIRHILSTTAFDINNNYYIPCYSVREPNVVTNYMVYHHD
jgi:hypothetical protein